MLYILGLIILLLIFSLKFKEGYLNYQDLPIKGSINNCSQIYADNFKKISKSGKVIQPYGYTKYRLFDISRFIKIKEPLPIEPDFFYKY